MPTDYIDNKTGPTYAPNQPIWTIDKNSGKKIDGTVLEVGDDSILVQWQDFEDPTEYERQQVELIGDQFYEDKRESGQLVIPRNNRLLLQVKDYEEKIIKWYKNNCNLTGYNCAVFVTEKGKWAVRFTVDYPMMPGVSREYILSEEDFVAAMQSKPSHTPSAE